MLREILALDEPPEPTGPYGRAATILLSAIALAGLNLALVFPELHEIKAYVVVLPVHTIFWIRVGRARWAASRAILAAPGDELLLAVRIRTEHAAGNAAETERLTLQLAAHARALGVDLDPATVSLLQQVMEGQVRARLA